MEMDIPDYTQGGIGAMAGLVLSILGFRSRINSIEKNLESHKIETQNLFREIRADIKLLIAKSSNRRKDDIL